VASLADLGAERFAAADHMGQETSLEVTGIVPRQARARRIRVDDEVS